MNNLKKLWLIGLCFLPWLSFSQNSNTLYLTLDQAIELGIKENLTRKISELEIEKKQAKINELYGNLMPNLKGSGTYNRNVERPVIFMPSGPPFFGSVLKMGFENSFTGALSAGLPIFNMAIYESIALAKSDKELSKEKLREAEIELATNIKKTYFNLLLINESYKVMNQSYIHAQENVKNIENMNKLGMVSDYDFIRAKVQVDNLRPNVIQLKKNYQNILGLLKVLLNMGDSVEVQIDTTIIAENYLQTQISMQVNLANNSTLKQLDLQQQLLKTQLNLTRSSLFPNLSAFGNYQYQAQADNYKFDEYKWVKTVIVGLQLNVPIFSGLTVRRQMQQIKISGKQLELQKEFQQKSLNNQVQTALANMQVASEKLQWATQNIALAKKGYDIAQTRYNTGQSTYIELNDADNALMQAELNLIQAKFEYLNAKFDLDKLMGNLK